MQTFNVSRGWKFFYIIVIPPKIALMGWFMMMPFIKGRSDQTGLILVCLLMGGGMLLLFFYALLSLFMCRFEIHPDKIKNVDPFIGWKVIFNGRPSGMPSALKPCRKTTESITGPATNCSGGRKWVSTAGIGFCAKIWPLVTRKMLPRSLQRRYDVFSRLWPQS